MMSRATEAPRSRSRRASDERHRLLGREVDDEEVRPGQRHGDGLRLHDRQHARDVEGEPDRRALVAEASQHVVVASAPRHRGAEAPHVRLEVRPGIVVEAAHLAQVEQDRVGQAVDRQQPVHLGQVGDGARRALVARERGRPLQHGLVAEQRRQRAQRIAHVSGRRQLAHHALERAHVLAGQRLPQLVLVRGIGLDLLQQAAEEVRMAEVELEALEAERAQPLDGHGDDLDLRLRLREPDQLDARLVELAVVRHARLVVAEDVGDVGQPHRLGLVAQPGGHDPRDLGRDVGAQRQHAAGLAVHQREHAVLHGDVGADRQHLGKLERGRDDLAIAPAPEDVEQPLLDVTLARGLVRQIDAGAARQLGRRLHGRRSPDAGVPADPARARLPGPPGARACSCGARWPSRPDTRSR